MHRMVKRHWRFLALLVVLLPTLPLSCVLLTWSPLERQHPWIRKGMTEDEVHAVMRRQPDVKGSFSQCWFEADEVVRVNFDFDVPRRVTGKHYITCDPRRRELLERLQERSKKL